jgi:hypothetical protein
MIVGFGVEKVRWNQILAAQDSEMKTCKPTKAAKKICDMKMSRNAKQDKNEADAAHPKLR